MNNFLFISGWGFSKNIFNGPDNNFDAFDWQEVISNPTLIEDYLSTKKNIILIGWSLGAFILQNHKNHKNVIGAVFISSGLTFIKSQLNPYGVSEKLIYKMIKTASVSEKISLKILNSFTTRTMTPPLNHVITGNHQERLIVLKLLSQPNYPLQNKCFQFKHVNIV